MQPLSETDRQAYAVVEAALRTYPRVKAPSHFAAALAARIQARQDARLLRPKFQFPWWELLASLVFLLTMVTLWLVLRLLPLGSVAQLRVQGAIILGQVGSLGSHLMLAWLIPLALLLAALCVGGALLGLVSSREWQS